jgi:NADPH:quinone reductase-like Zn-dependent oxidoreductase
MDFSGGIEKIGEDAPSGFKQGDEVYGQASVLRGGSGAFAEQALVDKDTIAHKPRTLNYEAAAALPLVGVSAWQALVENIGLSKDKKILIHGGAGGIGSIAIQLAKHLGGYIATTVSTNDKQFVQELGTDQIVDYKTEKFEDKIHDYDAVFDTVGGDTYKKSFKVLNEGSGIIVSMLEQPNPELMNQYGVKALFQFTKTFSLDEAAKALDYQKDVHPRGKVVLTV